MHRALVAREMCRGVLSLPVHAELLWLPPMMQEVFDLTDMCDRVRTFVRPRDAALPEAAGRDGNQRIGSKSHLRALSSQAVAGFLNPDLFDRFAHSGRRLLTLPLAPSLTVQHEVHAVPASAGSL